MLRLKAHKIEVKWFDFERTLFQSKGMTLINCEIELPYQVLPLLMKPTRQIELAFEIGLVFCFRYGLGDGELQVFFGESLTLSLVVQVHSLSFLASQIQKEHSMEDLLNL